MYFLQCTEIFWACLYLISSPKDIQILVNLQDFLTAISAIYFNCNFFGEFCD